MGQTAELVRVRDLPRRTWQDMPDLDRAVAKLTKVYRYSNKPCPEPCEGCKARQLKPAQAVALIEAYNYAGAFLPLRVGAGKTLTSFLLPTVLKAKRPLLIVPGSALEDTVRYHREHSRHWKLLPLTVQSYQFLGHPKHKDWLLEYQPDLIVADEAHKLKDPRSKVAGRLRDMFRAFPECVFVPLTGSASGRSMLEYWHYLPWALHGRSPVPRKEREAKIWALATDEKIPDEARIEPGALLQLGKHDPADPPVTQARKAYQDRLVSTPGVVSTLEDIPSIGLQIRATELPLPAGLCRAVAEMRRTWATPGGESFSDGRDLYRHSVTLGAGVYYKWDPPAPQDWLDARREWHAFARDFLSRQRKYDSNVHVAQLIDLGKLADRGVLARWRAIEPAFVPNPVPVWVDDTTLKYAADWLVREAGLVWVAQHSVGVRLSELTGAPFFSTGGVDPAGRQVSQCSGPMIVSMHSCREQKNLQYAHYKNLLLTVPPRGDWLEQLFGRTHRDGQPEDDVFGEILLTTKESYRCLAQCVRDARRTWDQDGQPQKMCYANRDLGFVEMMIVDIDLDPPGP